MLISKSNGLIEVTKHVRMFISPDLRFHLKEIDDPHEAWEKIESVFGKLNIIPTQPLENQVLTLSPNDFSCLGDYLSKFKTLRILCEECEIKMEEECCIYIILSKLGSAYYLFVSTFYAMREALRKDYQKLTLYSFCVFLIRKNKLVQLGVIITAGTSNKALVPKRKINPSIPRSNILTTTTKNIRIPNPLRQFA
jgi:hypothetical protein